MNQIEKAIRIDHWPYGLYERELVAEISAKRSLALDLQKTEVTDGFILGLGYIKYSEHIRVEMTENVIKMLLEMAEQTPEFLRDNGSSEEEYGERMLEIIGGEEPEEEQEEQENEVGYL